MLLDCIKKFRWYNVCGGNMNKTFAVFLNIIYGVFFAVAANSYLLIKYEFGYFYYLFFPFLIINIFVDFLNVKGIPFSTKIAANGAVLLTSFLICAAISVAVHIVFAFSIIPYDYMTFVWSAICSIVINAIIFWNGIIRVYLFSHKLGIKLRVKGALCGMIPVLNLIVLKKILVTVYKEVDAEIKRARTKRNRKSEKICKTKYPVLLVHGVFFRDTRFFNYWGRIPEELKFNGAKIFYGKHSSAASVSDSAKQLTLRIEQILKKTKAEKVNIIAHSKGGLDCRYAIANCGIAEKVASLTTVNTPHRGCLFADYLLEKIPDSVKNDVANSYNRVLKFLGEKDSDFIAAVNDLTDERCRLLDNNLQLPQGVFAQSIGSVMKNAEGGMFPLNYSYHLASHFDGENDGLVSEKSFKWGEAYQLLAPKGERGISHGDVIDLSRQDVDGFDIREFYVNLVASLKNKGL